MVSSKKMHSIGKNVLRTVGEPIGRSSGNNAHLQEMGEIAIKGDFAETYDDPNARQRLNLIGKMAGTVANLLWVGLVAGRRTADYGSDPRMMELEAILAREACGLAGKTQIVENGIHEGAGAVAGEGATGTVGSVCTRSEAQNENAGTGISEAGNGASPVDMVLIGAALRFAYAAAVVA